MRCVLKGIHINWMLVFASSLFFYSSYAADVGGARNQIGREVAIERHLQDDEEFSLSLSDLIAYGKKLFAANWTDQDGGGRPLTKGNGRGLSDTKDPLVGKRSFNRISGPDANSCAGCHNAPYGITGGGGDFTTNVFVLGQRFDFVALDPKDKIPTKGTVDEQGKTVALSNVANLRATPGMFGAGYIEMLAREMTEDLQKIRSGMRPGDSRILITKGIMFGRISRGVDGVWDITKVTGLPRASILTATSLDPPTLVVRPWHQAGNTVSVREFTNTALNHHHGIQTTERFGSNTDPDGDGMVNELTRADVTALSVYQATLPVPGQVIPNNPEIEKAIVDGQKVFSRIGCAECHIPALPLSKKNWVYTEPNPFNPSTNLRVGEAQTFKVDLNDPSLPQPRLKPVSDNSDVIMVPAFTDLKLHDITDPEDDYGIEPLDMNQPVWSPKFVAGNRKFITKRLWGAANEPPYFHHGLFTTLRQSVLAHAGEAINSRQAFQRLAESDQDALIEFLKSLQVLSPGTKHLVVDENFERKAGL